MSNKEKYHKYKFKYTNLKNNDMINQSGGDGKLDLWKQLYPELSNIIDNINQPEGLNYVCHPDSVRGKSVRHMFDILNNLGVIDLRAYYRSVVDELVEYDDQYHEYMYDLMIISLQCMIYLENKDDEKKIFNPGRGDLDPSNVRDPTIVIPQYNKLLSKYPYVKAMCPLGHDCPIWNTSELHAFKQPYQYFVNYKSADFDDGTIILTSTIIQNNEKEYHTELAIGHVQLWDHLIMPKDKYLYEMKHGMLSFHEDNTIHNLYEIEEYNKRIVKVKIPDECLMFDRRVLHGFKIKDKWWRSQPSYINIFCENRSGYYFWD